MTRTATRGTLAQVKRAILPGTAWEVTNHIALRSSPVRGTHRRQVTSASMKGFTLSMPGDRDRESHVQWPQGRHVTVNVDGTIEIRIVWDRDPAVTVPYLTMKPVRDGK